MKNEDLMSIKERYTNSLIEATMATGHLVPHISLFGHEKKNPEELHMLNMPFPEEMMSDDVLKDTFMKTIFPEFAKHICETYEILAVSWVSEAWLREKMGDMPVDYKDIPIKKEVIILTFETKDVFYCQTYDVLRKGKKVTSEGDLIDNVQLTKSLDFENKDHESVVEGRFTHLLKYFLKK